MHDLISRNRQSIEAISRAHGVRRIEVFGSAARGYDFDPNTSDVDFLVEFEDRPGDRLSMGRYLDLKEALTRLLGCPVDIVIAGSVRNPFVRRDIERSRELVHAA